ncbi:MAG TPA: chemotaxis protein CheA [Longimicrobium sp.]|nr:chemotaxis protein CheA [Longimicrobium sp.]
MDIDLNAVIEVFLAEAEEGLAAMENALLALEAQPGDAEPLHTVFRIAHTLKGDAATLGFRPVADFAHAVEDLLERLRAGEAAPTAERIALLLRAVDALRALIPAAAEGRDELSPAEHALLADVAASATEAPGTDEDAPQVAVAPSVPADGAAPAARRTLRVDVAKLDQALDLVGEIAIARGRMARLLGDGASRASLVEAHEEAERLHLELQEAVMKLRMVPLGPVFRPHLRTVRDLAAATGKRVRLVLEGEDAEVDTTVAQHLREPLLHMLRNAVDHGIETPDARRRAGKDPVGTITLSARHEGGGILVRMTDDGAGMDRARILARARTRGMVRDGEALSDAETLRLVLEAGFSTAETVTDLSGRGVGLDVVRRGVEALRGSVQLESRAGEGTTLTLRLPLSLALIDGFSVGVADETYVVPLESVVECLELPADRLEAEAAGVLSLRGEALPFLRLRDFLSVPGAAPRRESVVVIRHDAGRAGLVVDTLHGGGQAVIKPLGRVLKQVPGVSGSTILGNGRVGLILDVPALLRRAVERAAA